MYSNNYVDYCGLLLLTTTSSLNDMHLRARRIAFLIICLFVPSPSTRILKYLITIIHIVTIIIIITTSLLVVHCFDPFRHSLFTLGSGEDAIGSGSGDCHPSTAVHAFLVFRFFRLFFLSLFLSWYLVVVLFQN